MKAAEFNPWLPEGIQAPLPKTVGWHLLSVFAKTSVTDPSAGKEHDSAMRVQSIHASTENCAEPRGPIIA